MRAPSTRRRGRAGSPRHWKRINTPRRLLFQQLEPRCLLAGDIWSQRGGDAGHTSYVDVPVNPASISEVWFQELDYPQLESGSWCERAVAIDESHVYRTAREGYASSATYHVIAYDLSTGDEVWHKTLTGEGHEGVGEPSVAGGVVYVNRAGHSGSSGATLPRLYGLDAATGATALQHAYAAQWGSNERPVIEGNQLIVEDGYYGGISAYQASTLTRQWFVGRSAPYNPPFAALNDEFAFAFGDEVYRRSIGYRLPDINHPSDDSYEHSPIVAASGDVLLSYRGSVAGSTVRGVAAFDGTTHAHLWSFETSTAPSFKAVGNGLVAVTAGSDLYLVDETDGSLIRTWNGPSTLGEVLLTQTHAFVISWNGTTATVHAIDLESGEVDWTHSQDSPGGSELVEMAMSQGYLMLSDRAGVRAFQFSGENQPPDAVDDSYATPENTPLVVDPPGPEDVVLLFDDFESGVSPGWSDTTTSVTPVGDRGFLGEFGEEEVVLSLGDLPPHEEVAVEFDLYVLKSWDGNSGYYGPDMWRLDVDGGTTLLNTTFSNVPSYGQAYPDDYGGGSHSARTGATENYTLGYGSHGDSVYHLTFQFDHSADDLQLRFSSSGSLGTYDESWGLDNVRVAVPGWALGVLANDTDPDGDPLSAELVSTPSHGSLELNADGSFEYVPNEGFHGIDTFEYKANDGVDDSDPATVTVSVNDAPRAPDDAYAVGRDTSHSVAAADGVLRNDRDANADPLSAALVRGPLHGALTLSPDGSFVYEPDPYFAGIDTFTYKAFDGYVESNVATVTLRVAMIDADSSAVDDFYAVTADAPFRAGLVNGTFDSGDLTGWTTFTTPGGTLGGPGFPDVVAFDTNGDGVDTESVQFLVGDGGGGIFQNVELAAAGLTVTVDVAAKSALADAEGGLFELLVDGAVVASHDFGPIGADATQRAVLTGTLAGVVAGDHEIRIRVTRAGASAYGSSPLSFVDNVMVYGAAAGVLANDDPPESDLARALLVSPPEHGTLDFNPDGSFTYVPDPGFTGDDTFVYKWVEGVQGLTLYTVDKANDKLVTIDSASGELTVVGTIGYDMFSSDLAYMDGLIWAETDNDDGGFNDSGHTLVAMDPVTGAFVSAVPITHPEFSWAESLAADRGTLYLGFNNGSIGVLDPETGEITERITYQGRDFDGLAVDNDGFLVSVDGVNYSGSWRQIAFHRMILYPTDITFLGDYLMSDPGITDLEFTPSDSWVLASQAQLLFRNRVGNPSQRIEEIPLSPIAVSFAGLAYAPQFETNTATVTIAVSNPPVATNDGYAVEPDSVLSVPGPGVLENDHDPDADPLTAVLDDGPSHGSLTLSPDGSFTYTPEVGFLGLDRFTYKASDGLSESNLATVTLLVGTEIVVNSTADPGDGVPDAAETTLREAIDAANAVPGAQPIVFDVPTSDPGYNPVTGAFTIQPTSALPTITDPVTLDAATQPGFAGTPIIELDGSLAGTDGLVISADNSTVRGLVINRFSGSGIVLDGGSHNAVEGNFIGTDVTGTVALANGGDGVEILNGAEWNRIGTDGDGLTDTAERNLISGNAGQGCFIKHSPADSGGHNVVAGNFIGTDVSGTSALGNGGAGVIIVDAPWNRIGTDGDGVADAAQRNLISANAIGGVRISGRRATDNVVAGNFLGTDVTGAAALGNGRDGVRIGSEAESNLVGTDGDGVADADERNVISGNVRYGVQIVGDADHNVVAGNFIGTDLTGTGALGNGRNGVHVWHDASSNRIGTNGDGVADAAERNVISANGESGVHLVGMINYGVKYNVVAGNFIGTDVTGTAALGNAEYGVWIAVGSRFNRIGTDGNGTADSAERNVISGNGQDGVYLSGGSDPTRDNVVAGNFIGTDVTGSAPLQNQGAGVSIYGTGYNRIGTDGNGVADEAERNLISANGASGVHISGEGAWGNVVAGNFIGTDASGTVALGNGGSGIAFWDGAASNQIGGNAQLANTVAYNTGAGVALLDENTTGNSIQANSIFANGALGIDLGIDGVTANDAADPDLGPNKLQNYPVIDAVVPGASTRVVGSVNSVANTEFTLDFYANSSPDPSGYGEGERWLGSTVVATDAVGDATFDVLLPAATTAGETISATATDPDGNTSEFSVATSYVPLAVNDAYLADVNTQLAAPAASGVLANDYGAESMEAVWVSGPSHGVLALQPDGSFVYDPALDFNGYDSFTYKAADGLLESDPVTVSIFVAESLGPLSFRELDGQNPSAGDVYYQWTTTHDAFLTLEAMFDAAAGSAQLTLYNESCAILATSALVGGNQRIDWQVGAGETYFFKLSGTNGDVDLRLANLVSHAGTAVTVYGTLDEDLFEFDAAASRLVTINGVSYHFTDAEATSISFDGAAAADTAVLNGNDQNETAELWPEHGTLTGDDYSVEVDNVETITVHGGGGADLAFLHDDPLAKDTLTGGPDLATLSGNPYSNQVANFRYVHVYGTPGNGDEAIFQGDPGLQDTFEAWPGEAKISAKSTPTDYRFFIRAKSFADVRADGTPGGGDIALLHDDPAGVDTFVGGPDQAELSGNGFLLQANSFRYAHVYGTAGGGDMATLNDDPARFDRLRVWPDEAKLWGEEFFLRAKSFDEVYANSTPDTGDLAQLYDSPGDDTFTAWPDRAELSGNPYLVQVNSYRYVHGYSSEGNDVATLLGSDGRDVFVGTDRFGKLRGTNFYNRAVSYGQLHVYGGDGRDVAVLHDAVLEEGVTQPVGMAQVAWLYEFERIRQRSESGETIIDVVDQIFTAYWV